MESIKSLWQDENGQGMVEYGLIIALVAVLAIGALSLMGGRLSALFSKITDTITP